MPAGNGMGPRGLGPMTGRAAGYCAGYPVPMYMNPVPGRGRWTWPNATAYGPGRYLVPFGYGGTFAPAWGRPFGRLGRGFGHGWGRRIGRGRGRGWW